MKITTEQYLVDRAATLRNRAALSNNVNLLYWYEQLYRDQFSIFVDSKRLAILEIGSGVSPLQRFYPNAFTSDVMELDYVEYVFDAHQIDQLHEVGNETLDVITLTNVLHHLEKPLEFLRHAVVKLKPGGRIIATEPYFSILSTWIFKYLHHEAVNLAITQPRLRDVQGPVTSANIALPWLIFFRRPQWRNEVLRDYDIESVRFFTSLAYMVTGGISRRIPMPHLLYRGLFQVDLFFSRLARPLCASFFTVILKRRS